MKHLAAALVPLVLAGTAWSQELTGTPYTLVWRGSAYAQRAPGLPPGYGRQPPAAGVVLRVVDVTARRELARAAYDARLGGWLFQLPMAGFAGPAPRCLGLVDPRNQYVAVRPSSGIDNGAGFRNPLWERELTRHGDLAALTRERDSVRSQVQTVEGDIARLVAEIGLPEGSRASQCPTPPAPPDPPRPPGALDPAQAADAAGRICAWRWERDHGSRAPLGRLFSDAGLDGDWNARGDVRAVAEDLPDLRIPIVGADLALVLDAAQKGRTYLEHADGVRVLTRAHGACRAEVARTAAASRLRWQQATEMARQAPQRAVEQCAQKLDRIGKLRSAQAAAPALLAVLDQRIAELSSPPPGDQPVPLHHQLCQP